MHSLQIECSRFFFSSKVQIFRERLGFRRIKIGNIVIPDGKLVKFERIHGKYEQARPPAHAHDSSQ